MSRISEVGEVSSKKGAYCDLPATRGEEPKKKTVSREQRTGNSEQHAVSIEPSSSKGRATRNKNQVARSRI